MSREVKGTVTKLELLYSPEDKEMKFEMTVTVQLPKLENLRVGNSLVVTLPEGK